MREGAHPADLFVTTIGSGPPVLVMHGGLGLDHTSLRPGLDRLSDSVELIYYDHRGNGRSAAPQDWSKVTHASFAADADALRIHLGLERVFLFGHSYGGFLALEYALRYPQRILGLVLCSTAPSLNYPEVILENAKARATDEQLKAVTERLFAPVADDADLQSLWTTIVPLYFHDRSPAHVERFRQTVYRGDAFNRAFFHCLPTYDVTDRLGEITAPTLILSGDDDWIAPASHGALRLHAGIRDAQLRIFEASGHFPFLERPDEFGEIMGDWIAEHLPRQAVAGAGNWH